MREESRSSTGWRDCRPGSMVRWGLHGVNSFDGLRPAARFERLRIPGSECFETIENGCYGSFRQSESL